MEVTARISIDVSLGSEQEALELVNRSLNDELDDLEMKGIAEKICDCNNLTVDNVYVNEDGIPVERYRLNNGSIRFNLIRSIKRVIDKNDAVMIDGNTYFITILSENAYNLYSCNLHKFYFPSNLGSIAEINEQMRENDVEFEIYVCR